MDIRSIGTPPSVSTMPGETVARAPAPKTAAPVELLDAVEQSAPVPSMEHLDEALEKINRAMESQARGLEFSLDEESKRTIVKIVDQQTKEILRQMPSEEALAIARALDQLQGLLIQQQA